MLISGTHFRWNYFSKVTQFLLSLSFNLCQEGSSITGSTFNSLGKVEVNCLTLEINFLTLEINFKILSYYQMWFLENKRFWVRHPVSWKLELIISWGTNFSPKYHDVCVFKPPSRKKLMQFWDLHILLLIFL